MLKIAATASISRFADIEDSIKGSIIEIGEHCMVDSFVKIKPAGGSGNIIIGSYCYINAGSVLYVGNGIRMGDNVLIAANCTLAPTNHTISNPDLPIRLQGFAPSKGGIVIENDVWVGAGCVILDGAVLERGCVIGANSTVSGRVEAFSINVGSPLRKIGSRKTA